MLSSALLLVLLPLASAASVPTLDDHGHDLFLNTRLPDKWYHADDHPVHALFKRGGATDGTQYAPVGSASA